MSEETSGKGARTTGASLYSHADWIAAMKARPETDQPKSAACQIDLAGDTVPAAAPIAARR